MRRMVGSIGLALVAGCLMATASVGEPPEAAAGGGAERDDAAVRAALDRAIEDERGAIAFYEAVMARFGERPPFSNIVRSERRHEAMLLAEYERLGLTPPADAAEAPAVPLTFAEAADASEIAEVLNARLYDELLASTSDPVTISVFERLRDASVQRHLPAFRRHSNGWRVLPDAERGETHEAAVQRAVEARDALASALLSRVAAALSEGGAASAVEVCAEVAPRIAEEIGDRYGVQIGRTGERLRNPDNDGPVWVPLLTLGGEDAAAKEPRVGVDRRGRVGVVSPIFTAGFCLQCHGGGSDISAETARALRERYPSDRATGFGEGDLRGWFWVEVPSTEGAAAREAPGAGERGGGQRRPGVGG